MRLKIIVAACVLIAVASAQDSSKGTQTISAQPSKEYQERVLEGNKLFDDGKYVEASRVYEEAIKLDARQAEAYFELGQTLNALKDYAGADRNFQEAIQRDGENWLYLLGKANNADDAGKPQDALTLYGEAIEAAPSKGKLRYNRAVTYLKLKQLDEAVADLLEAERVEPNYVSPYFMLGRVYLSQNKLMLASEQLGKVLELEKTGDRRKKAQEITKVDIVLDSAAPKEEGPAHLSYCLARANALSAKEYHERHPGAENYVDNLEEEVYILGKVATILSEVSESQKKPIQPQFASFVKAYKAGYLAPYVLVTTGDRYAQDAKDYETKNPGKITEFKKWANENQVGLSPVQFRCQVKWMGQTY